METCRLVKVYTPIWKACFPVSGYARIFSMHVLSHVLTHTLLSVESYNLRTFASAHTHHTVCTLYSIHIIQYAHYTVCTLYSMHIIQYAHYTVCTLYSIHTLPSLVHPGVRLSHTLPLLPTSRLFSTWRMHLFFLRLPERLDLLRTYTGL